MVITYAEIDREIQNYRLLLILELYKFEFCMFIISYYIEHVCMYSISIELLKAIQLFCLKTVN